MDGVGDAKYVKPSKLSDLNEDCLLEIFKNFSVEDLFNIIEYDNCVLNAAQHVFEKHFCFEYFSISNEFDRDNETVPLSVRFLNYFGSKIRQINIKYDEKYRGKDYLLDETLFTKCNQSLYAIKFENAGLFTMDEIDKPFKHVTFVHFVRSKFNILIRDFGKWFPNAHTLILENIKLQEYNDLKLLENHHPKLERFEISNSKAENTPESLKKKVRNCNLKVFFKLNPQLETLAFICDDYDSTVPVVRNFHDFNGIKLDWNLLSSLKYDLKNLHHLHLNLKHDSLNADKTLQCVELNKLTHLTVTFKTPNVLKNFPISIKKITNLVLHGSYLDLNCKNFIKQTESVQLLNLYGPWVPGSNYEIEMIQTAASLPKLKVFQFAYYITSIINADVITDLLMISSFSLKKIVLNAVDVPNDKQEEVLNKLQLFTDVDVPMWTANFHDEWNDYRRYRLTFDKTQH